MERRLESQSQEASVRILPEARLRIADLVLEMLPGAGVDAVAIQNSHAPFLVDSGCSDCTLVVNFAPDVAWDWGRFVFGSGVPWSLYWNGTDHTIPFVSPAYGPRPFRIARFDADFRHGDLYVHEQARITNLSLPELALGKVAVAPCLSPLDELILVNLLSRGRGLYIHGCGVSDGRQSVAFCGVSRAGKSTTARLWVEHEFVIQSDDRLILRPAAEGICCWGTPWHGDAGISSPLGAPLRKLYFIEHGVDNRITSLTPAEAARRLMVTCFPTFYDAAGMSYTLEFVSQVCTRVPCARLEFVPDQRVVDLVLKDSFDR